MPDPNVQSSTPPPLATPVSPVPTALRAPKRTLHISVLFLVVLYMASPIVSIVVGAFKLSPEELGRLAGQLLVVPIAWLISCVVWSFSRRSKIAYNLTFAALIILSFLGRSGAGIQE